MELSRVFEGVAPFTKDTTFLKKWIILQYFHLTAIVSSECSMNSIFQSIKGKFSHLPKVIRSLSELYVAISKDTTKSNTKEISLKWTCFWGEFTSLRTFLGFEIKKYKVLFSIPKDSIIRAMENRFSKTDITKLLQTLLLLVELSTQWIFFSTQYFLALPETHNCEISDDLRFSDILRFATCLNISRSKRLCTREFTLKGNF